MLKSRITETFILRCPHARSAAYQIFCLLLSFTVPFGAEAASFICGPNANQVELWICTDPELSALDDQLAMAYSKVLANTADQEQLRYEQRRWVKNRNACPDTACVSQAFRQRLPELNARLEASRTNPSLPMPAPVVTQRLPDNGGRLGIGLRADYIFKYPDGSTIVTATVTTISSDGSAHRSGLKVGDRIRKIDGYSFMNLDNMVSYIHSLTPGSMARFELTREPDHSELFVGNIPIGPMPRNNNNGLSAALVIGGGLVLLCALTNCMGQGAASSTQTPSDNAWGYRPQYTPRNEDPPPVEEPALPDTSIGCAWGDRAYGTCH
jgi:uncharacterized protein YecT (DUF1311 family)